MTGNIKEIALNNEKYPKLLREISSGPKLLYYLGKLPNPEDTSISIVGTRKATPEGKLMAKQIAKELAARGITIVSGLALGIDAAAHEGALKGGGKTIAVLANGLNSIYPKVHENLAKEIIKKDGAIISEYRAETPPYPNQFLERNRIVSGLSIATVIIEVPIRSGSLVTAKHALDQGREVFVMPGPTNHQNYKGSHLLIRNGARLVTGVEDILEDLGDVISNLNSKINFPQQKLVSAENDLGLDKNLIFRTLKTSKNPITVDSISEITKLKPQTVNAELTFLMLEGVVEEIGGRFRIK